MAWVFLRLQTVSACLASCDLPSEALAKILKYLWDEIHYQPNVLKTLSGGCEKETMLLSDMPGL